jgi:MoxR-like ATPase
MNNEEAARVLIGGAEPVIRGKREFLEFLTAAILAKGHVLIEDNPGLGKTTVAKTLAKLITGSPGDSLIFKRIQFTPDLLPYDITGVDVFDPETRSFRFVPGPVLANIVLADEINRTTPKVQAALLEVMAERQVTIGSETHQPPAPFFVIATQNPVESEGTFPLPAAQLDRFMMRLSLGYPSREAELSILEDNPSEHALHKLEPVMTTGDFLAAQNAAEGIFCHPALREAIADMVRDTRTHRGFILGASPRAALHFLGAAKALALVRGREYVIDEDVIALAGPVLTHRLKLRDPRASGEKLIQEICLARIDGIKTACYGGNLPKGRFPAANPHSPDNRNTAHYYCRRGIVQRRKTKRTGPYPDWGGTHGSAVLLFFRPAPNVRNTPETGIAPFRPDKPGSPGTGKTGDGTFSAGQRRKGKIFPLSRNHYPLQHWTLYQRRPDFLSCFRSRCFAKRS